MDSAIGHLVSPKKALVIEVGQGGEGSSGEEIRFDIADISFDAPLFMGGFNIAGGGIKEVVGGEGEESGIELDGGADAAENDAGQVVVPDFLWDPLKEMESPGDGRS